MAVTIAGSGQVVTQVIFANTSTNTSTSSSTYVTTGLSANITPRNSANRVLITATFPTDGGASAFTIYRGGTALACDTIWEKATGSRTTTSITFLDSPSTTSATTYTLYFKAVSGTAYFIGSAGYYGSITLQEIAYA